MDGATVDLDELEAIGMGPKCPICGREMDWLRCEECFGEGYHDDLYDLDPLWYEPGDVEPCEVCDGRGGWWRCWDCKRTFDQEEIEDKELGSDDS